MNTTLVPFRTYHFRIPQQSVMKALSLILDHEIDYSLNSVTEDGQFLLLTLSVNLHKKYQCLAAKQIEQLLTCNPTVTP